MNESTFITKTRVKCRDIMSRNVTLVTRDAPIIEAAQLLREGDIGILPVVDDLGKLIGVITDRDIVVRAVAEGLDGAKTSVGDIMTAEPFTVSPGDFAFEAARVMREKRIRRVPVEDSEGAPVGVVSIADIALEMEDEKEIAETLEEISSGSAFWGKR